MTIPLLPSLLPLPLRDAEASDGETLACVFFADRNGHAEGALPPLVSADGFCLLKLPPVSAAIFISDRT